MYAGIPYCSVSTDYSLVSKDFSKLHYIFKLLSPGLVYAADGVQYEHAIRAALPPETELVVNVNPIPGATNFGELVNVDVEGSLEAAHARVHADTVFKILFTPGATGMPKGVINTHRMWASNQEMTRSFFAFLADEPPVLVNSLPWSHTSGGNADLGMALYNGGSLYIDRGQETIHTLRMIAPTIYCNVPKAFELLAPYLQKDAGFRKHFFSRLKLLYCTGAALSQQLWDDFRELAVEECGERILMVTGFGATETAPQALFSLPDCGRPDTAGVPLPGIELKLVPDNHGKLEARLRGPNVTPGYWRRLDLTRATFDEDGFYKSGDALRFVDESDPGKGFVFDGRLAEDFKLSSGTWVSAGPLRASFIAHCAPYVQDVVFTGQDREYVGALVFLSPEGRAMAERAAVFSKLLQSFEGATPIARAIVLEEAPSIDAHEITDQGTINQKAVLENRREIVEELYEGSSRTIVVALSVDH
jgi:feruloyl-CoA synthase